MRRPRAAGTRTALARTAIALAATAALASACTAGGGSSGPAAAPGDDEEVTITVWSNFADRELGIIQDVLDAYHDAHPNITIKNVGSQDDDKITQAIRSGNPPDVSISFTADNIGQFCSSGAWQDLGPYIERDKYDLDQIPEAVQNYTEYKDTRCALPMLADVFGMYYNQDLLTQAGITEPPKTFPELTEMAKKLTVRDPDGTIKVAGFIPQFGFYENTPQVWAAAWGAQWIDSAGKSSLATDPTWAAMFEWQKELVDWYGWDNLQKFTAGLGQEFSADNAFHQGKVAMMFDGEFRTAFIEADTPDLNYGTAPMPVPADKADAYGGGYTSGTIIGLPKGSKNAGAGWELIKYLTADTDALVQLANGLHNVPSTKDSLTSPDLDLGDHFQTFLDIFDNPNLQTNPGSPNGGAYTKSAADFANLWQSGDVDDLPGELAKLDKQIDDAKALSEK